MKKSKKIALVAATFAVALNINGCVYGAQRVVETENEDVEQVSELITDSDSSNEIVQP